MYSLSYYIKNPYILLNWCMSKLSPIIPAKLYIKLQFKAIMGYRPNLRDPKTFCEKINWLKLYDHNPKYPPLVDKYSVKDIIAKEIWEEYIIPTLWVRDKFDDIDFDKLPNQFVLKCNHDSGSVVICRDKKHFDKQAAKIKLSKALKSNFYYFWKERVYKTIKPKILAEKYMEDSEFALIRDYKFFCFNWEPKIMYLSEWLEDHSTAWMSFFDMNFKLLDLKRADYRLIKWKVEKPKTFEQMKSLASLLSKGIPHVRVDFYEINWHIYFGELTFYTCAWYIPFEDKKRDFLLWERIKLPHK